MGKKSIHDYVCLNENDSKFLKQTPLEDVLDVNDGKNVPLRKKNIRKSIDYYLEQQRLRKHIVDFDLFDEH